MKSFIQHLKEFAQYSTSDLVFKNNGQGSAASGLNIPISGPMFKRIWPDTIRATVFHATDSLEKLGKLEGGKKSISAFFSMMSRYMESGVATSGGVVVEMDADVLISARDDIMSQVDKGGRRWVEMSWFENAQSWGNPAGFNKVERELNDLIRSLVIKHLGPIMGQTEVKRAFEYDLWADMKRHLKAGTPAGAKKLSLVIKDYFDGVERIIKANKEVMSSIFYGYAKSKRQTDNAWDEQIVNNIKIKKVHVLLDVVDDGDKEEIELSKLPAQEWEYASELEIYIRGIVTKERGK